MTDQRPLTGEGDRLAKRVAALQGCSRREAEALIEGGWVAVDGLVVDDPARRVDMQEVTVASDAQPLSLTPVTLLWHKPAGVALAADQLVQGLVAPDQTLRPWHLKHLRCASPMPAASSGLAVFAQHPSTLRMLREQGPLLEHEWMLDVSSRIEASTLAALVERQADLAWGPRNPTLKLSISSQGDDRTRLRLAIKTYTPQRLPAWLAGVGLTATTLQRLRLGRVALGPLASGDWRLLTVHERL
jgi:23S rRNA pseudouridine2604 synthase